MKHYDAVIIGTGAGGGTVAALLAEAGKHILVLERGRALSFTEVGRDNLRNQRISLYGHNAGPDIEGNPRVAVSPNGHPQTIKPHEGGYQNNAATVGGGTRVYLGQAWRFLEKDFRMASEYGVPEGSSLADWPLTYADLEPYYDRAEWEVGVSGNGEANVHQAPRKRGYPMPAQSPPLQSRKLQDGAKTLGWNTFPIPFLINTVPYNGREACIRCNHCVGFACPTDAKNGSQNTMLPRALATGNCELITSAMTERIETDSRGNVVGITYITEEDGTPRRETVRAKSVVVSAGATESARLLLNSATTMHPRGLGNSFDHVGRNLQGHYYPNTYALMEEDIYDGQGPGAHLATCQFSHGNPGVIGGGMLADELTTLPIIVWKNCLPPDVPKWGIENKRWMRENYRKLLRVMGPVQDIPSPEGRVTLDSSVRDKYGIPVVRVSGTTHSETVKTARFMWEKSREWVKATGAVKIWGNPPGLFLSGGQHQAGTCRMGREPETSVTDQYGRVHAHDNLFVVDTSLHVTNGGFNPVLTVFALAFRCAEHIAKI